MSHRGLLAIETELKGPTMIGRGSDTKMTGCSWYLFGLKKAVVVALFKRYSASKRPQWELPRYLFIGYCTETKYDRKHFRSKQNLAIFNISDEHPRHRSCVSLGYNLVPCIKG